MRTRTAARTFAALTLVLCATPALAQLAHHPFAVGASEGAVGHQNALGAWLLGMESRFYLQLTAAVRATNAGPAGALTLVGLSFAYGVFHAAGPGHGKAVITSYMVSNEVALRRGLVIALLAALVQGLVATAIVGFAAFVFAATAPTMTAASQAIELASYLGIVALGLVLVWRKGHGLLDLALGLMRDRTNLRGDPAVTEQAPTFAGFAFAGPAPAGPSLRVAAASTMPARRFVADDGALAHVHGPGCECGHMPDTALLADPRFDWKAAAVAVVTAGARPCSGAILVLVFALSQGIFAAGIASTFAMSLGTALTTGALATFAVFAKDAAMRISGTDASRAALIGRAVELAAAVAVLAFGVALLAAALAGVHQNS